MSKLLMKLMLLFCLLPMAAKAMLFIAPNTTVTATVSDTKGHALSNGTWTAELVLPRGGTATVRGVPVPSHRNGVLNENGVMNATLADTRSMDQPGAEWKITICPNANLAPNGAVACSTYTTATTGASLDLTSKLGSTAPPLSADKPVATSVPAGSTSAGTPGGSICNLQYNLDGTNFGGDSGSCTDGVGNISVRSLIGKFVSSLAMGKQWRTSSSSADGCQNAYNAGSVTCVVEPGYTNDAGIVPTSTNPAVHSVDTNYAGQSEVVQNTQAYNITGQVNWTKRYLYYADNKMAGRVTGDFSYSQRPLAQQEVYSLPTRGRDENSGPYGQWAVGTGRYSVMQSNGEGIRQHDASNTYCYSLGDCMWHYGYLFYAGGNPEGSGEGYRGWAQHVVEQSGDFQGPISSVVSQTAIRVAAPSTGIGSQGVGRYLVDKKGSAKYTGNITAATVPATYGLTLVTTDATFTPSQWIGQGTTSVPAASNMDSPALASVTLTTAYGTDASTLHNGDNVCIASTNSTSGEEVTISSLSVTGSSVTFSAPMRHGQSGYSTAAKGPCWALDATGLHLRNSAGIMNALMIVGFPSSNTMLIGTWFLGGASPIYSTILSNINHSCTATFSQSGTTVTAAITSSPYCTQYFSNNPSIKVVGTTDFDTLLTGVAPVYNGNVGVSVLTWTVATSATIAGEVGTISTTNTSPAFSVWPMAVIYNVCDPGVTTSPTYANSNPCLNGYMDLETNSVSWAVNDPVEIPHGNAMRVNGGFLNLSQDTLINSAYGSGLAIQAAGEGWGNGAAMINLAAADSNYFGTGGRYAMPPIGLSYRGPNINTINTNAPTVPNNGSNSAVIYVNCATNGNAYSGFNCAKTPEYYVWQSNGIAGYFGITADPQTGTIGLNTQVGAFKVNAPFQFWPIATTYGTARLPKVGNAFFDTTTNHFKIANNSATFSDLAYLSEVGNASNLTSGTVPAARMPAFTGDCTTSAGSTNITCVGAASYNDVTSSRVYATNYTNSTGHRIKVRWTGTDVGGSHSVQLVCYVGTNDVTYTEVGTTNVGSKFTVECDVPNGSTYQVTTANSGGFTAATIYKVFEETF